MITVLSVRKFFHRLFSFVAVLILLIAVLISFARALTPLLNNHKDYFSAWLMRIVGVPVTLQNVEANFNGLGPSFTFHNVSIFNVDKKQLFHLNTFSIDINLLESLLQWRLVAGSLLIDGVSLNVHQTEQGEWMINGQHLPEAFSASPTIDSPPFSSTAVLSPTTEATLGWIFAQQNIMLKNLSIQWQRGRNMGINLPMVNLHIWNTSQKHRMRGQATLLLGKQSVPIDMVLSARGNGDKPLKLAGSLFVKIDHLPLPVLNEMLIPNSVQFIRGDASLKSWINFSDQQLSTFQSLVNLRNVNMKFDQAHTVNLDNFSANLQWSHLPNRSWAFTADDIHLSLNHHIWPVSDVGFESIAPGSANAMQSLHVGSIDLKDLGLLISDNQWVPENIRHWWKALQPQGVLQNIDLVHRGEWSALHTDSSAVTPKDFLNAIPYFYGHAMFSQLGVEAYQSIPGFAGLNGQIFWQAQHAQVRLDGQQGAVYFPTLFNNVLPFSELHLLVNMEYQPDRWQITLNHFDFINSYLNASVQATVQGGKIPLTHVDMLANFTQTNTAFIKRLFPYKIMSKDLHDWLDAAFSQGQAETGNVIFRGNLEEYPFKKSEGIFQSKIHVNDVSLNYAPGWPIIEHLNANLLFENASMDVQALSGIIFNQPIIQAQAKIADMVSDHPSDLLIQSKVNVDSQNLLSFIQNSPLKTTLSGLKKIKMQGATQLNLGLAIPLDETGNVRVLGKLNIDHNQFQLLEPNIRAADLSGQLTFTENGVSAEQINATLFNHPARIQLKTIDTDKKNSYLQIDIHNHLNVADIEQMLALTASPYIQGETDYHATLKVSSTKNNQLRFTSDLKGVTLNLPPPYGKAAEKTTLLKFDNQFNDQQMWLHFSYGQLMDGAFLLSGPDRVFKNGELALGGKKANYPTEPGLLISGSIPQLDWKTWQAFYEKNKPALPAKNAPPASSSVNDTLRLIDISVGKLTAFGQTLEPVQLQIQHLQNQWVLGVNSDNILGTIKIPDAFPKKTLAGKFVRLYLQTPESQNINDKNNTGSTNFMKLKPDDVPPLALEADDFHYGKSQFGAVQLDVAPIDQGLNIQYLRINSDLIDLSLTGQWLSQKGHQKTKISGEATIKDLGAALNNWNVTDKFSKGKGVVNFNLRWAAAPYDFTPRGFNGLAKIELKDGAIVHLDSSTDAKIGLGKVLNILSLQSIAKRLSLNFDDLSTNGYTYDNFTGNYEIKQGVITTHDTKFEGSVADISMEGSVDLNAERYNLTLSVVPHLTSSAPLIATLIALPTGPLAPLIGATTWVANQIVSPAIDQATRSTFALTGDWTNPSVTEINTNTSEKMKGDSGG